MALTNYDDPQDPGYQDPYQNPGYVPPAGPLVDSGPGSVPTFYGGVNADAGHGGGLPLMSLLSFFKHIPSIFHLFKPGGGSKPSAPPPPPNSLPTNSNTNVPPVVPLIPLSSPPPANQSKDKTWQQQLAGASPDLLALILGLLNKPEDVNANNPALAALNANIPQLTKQLNDLLANDVQRRQMSDPLYQAVLRGSMGQLPVWMRGGSSINPPVIPTTPTNTSLTTPRT